MNRHTDTVSYLLRRNVRVYAGVCGSEFPLTYMCVVYVYVCGVRVLVIPLNARGL